MLSNQGTSQDTSRLLKQLTFKAAKLPTIYLLIGIILASLSYARLFLPLEKFKNLFAVTDKLGLFFTALALATFIYNFIALLCRGYEKRNRETNPISVIVVESFRKGLRVMFVLAVIAVGVKIISPSEFYVDLAENVTKVILIGFIGWFCIQILYTYEAFAYQYMIKRQSQNQARAKAYYTKTHIIRNMATVIIIILTFAAILMSFDSVRNIGISLLASAGFLTAIAGLSAQKTLGSLFSGFQMALSQTIKMGDNVTIEGRSGIVEEITFTYVTLKLDDRRKLVVPINYFLEKPFENCVREPDSYESSLNFHVDYLLPIEPLRTELESILENSPHWDKKTSKLQVADLTDRSVEITAQISAAQADSLAELRAEVREKLLNFIRSQYPDRLPQWRFDNASSEAPA